MVAGCEQELLVGVLPLNDVEADEVGEEDDDLASGKTAAADDGVEGERLVVKDVEDAADGIGMRHHHPLRSLRLAPDGQVDGRGDDVLVRYADVGSCVTLLIDGTDGSVVGRRNGGDDDGAAVDVVGVELDAGLGPAIAVGRQVHHVDFFFGTDTGHIAVVADAN